ncbi:MAG: Gfo/Idh/MocA family oxidoreductase, partial [Clostridia bacterium]|nr:Gfo/Idh/MocA family oxidoreductase [Clostridia bacterium]
MRKAVIGIIGCGMIARDVHLDNAHSNPRIHVKWCCDISEEALCYVKDKYHPDYLTSDYKEILIDSDVDGVMVLTTHDIREKIIVDAALAGKHIYVEKPMSTTVEESYRIMKVIRQTGVKLVVGFNRRCSPAVEDAIKIYRDHAANPVDAPWRFKRLKKHLPLREEEATMVMMRVNDDLMSFKSYALDEMIGEGSIIGELCHFIDLARFIIGKEPVKVYAEGWARVNQVLTLQFEDQSIAAIFETGVGSFDHTKELIEIYHKGASIAIDHYLQLRVGGVEGIYTRDYPFLKDPYPYITNGEGSNLYNRKVMERNRIAAEKGSAEYPAVDKGHSKMLDRFID